VQGADRLIGGVITSFDIAVETGIAADVLKAVGG